MKKLTSLVAALVAAVMVVTGIAPVTVEAKTTKGKVQDGIYVASFDTSKDNYVKSVKFDKKGNLVVKANFKFGTENKNGIMVWKSTGMKTFTFKQWENGNGVDGMTDFYLHNYKKGKTNPKFYHYTQDEFIKSVNKRYGTSWRLVITTGSAYKMTSAAIVKYSGSMTNYEDTCRYGYSEYVTSDEWDWAELMCARDGSPIGWGPEAIKIMDTKSTYTGELIR